MKRCKAERCLEAVTARGMWSMHYQRWRRQTGLALRTASNGDGGKFVACAIKYRGTDCYLWPYGRTSGYGSIRLDGRSMRAHRIVCEATYGPPPFRNADAAHSCGVRACCNPLHLRWDTRKGNMNDTLTHGTRLLGERVTGAKLTAEDVIAIRSLPGLRQYDLAREYCVSQSNISQILNHKRWRYVP